MKRKTRASTVLRQALYQWCYNDDATWAQRLCEDIALFPFKEAKILRALKPSANGAEWNWVEAVFRADKEIPEDLENRLLPASEIEFEEGFNELKTQRVALLLSQQCNDLIDGAVDLPGFMERAQEILSSTTVRGDEVEFMTLDGLAQLKTPDWLVHDFLPSEGYVVLYGPPGSGKTFFSLDLALSVCSGASWHGREVQRGDVLYLAGEGAAGLYKRIHSWQLEHAVSDEDLLGFRAKVEPFDLVTASELPAFLERARQLSLEVRLVVIDPLARFFSGDENSADSMGKFVHSVDKIRSVLKCCVLVDHHTAKHASFERGSSALRGAATTMISCTQDGESLEIAVTKQKDAELPPVKYYTLGTRDDTKSCVVRLGTVHGLSPQKMGSLWTLLEAFSAKSPLQSPRSPAELLPYFKGKRSHLFNVLNRGKALGLVEKTEYGKWRLTEEGITRVHDSPQ